MGKKWKLWNENGKSVTSDILSLSALLQHNNIQLWRYASFMKPFITEGPSQMYTSYSEMKTLKMLQSNADTTKMKKNVSDRNEDT